MTEEVWHALVAKRVIKGCHNCGRPWSDADIQANRPATGSVCNACWDGIPKEVTQ